MFRCVPVLGGAIGLVVGAALGVDGRLADDGLIVVLMGVLGLLLAAVAGALFLHGRSPLPSQPQPPVRAQAPVMAGAVTLARAVTGFVLGGLGLSLVLGFFMALAFALSALSEVSAVAQVHERWPVTVEHYVGVLLEWLAPYLVLPLVLVMVPALVVLPEVLLRVSGGAAIGGIASVWVGMPFLLLELFAEGGGPRGALGGMAGGLLGGGYGVLLALVVTFAAGVLCADH